jgi:hypothetical protein
MGVCEWSIQLVEIILEGAPRIRVLVEEKNFLNMGPVGLTCTQWGGLRDQYITCITPRDGYRSNNPELFKAVLKFRQKGDGGN